MPLSEYEQRVLDQLEHDLGHDASLHRAMTRGPRTPARVIGAAVGVVIGLGIVVVGVMTQLALVGIAGFVVMAAVVLWALLGPRKTSVPASDEAPAGTARPQRKGPQPSSNKDFMQRMEERFDRRREQGEL